VRVRASAVGDLAQLRLATGDEQHAIAARREMLHERRADSSARAGDDDVSLGHSDPSGRGDRCPMHHPGRGLPVERERRSRSLDLLSGARQ